MLRSYAVAAVALALSAGAGVGVTGCGGNASSPASASTCEQLVQRAAVLTRQIVHDLQGKTVADLRSADPNDPFAELLRPYDAYRTRATQLGCDQGELVRLACTQYQDIAPTGPVAEEFLARVTETCR